MCGRFLAGIAGSNLAGGMDVSRECCVLSGRGLCDEPITRPEQSYRMWCVCDLETSAMRRPAYGCPVMKKKSEEHHLLLAVDSLILLTQLTQSTAHARGEEAQEVTKNFYWP